MKFRSDHLLKQEDFTRAKALLLSATGFSDFKSQEQRISVALSCFTNIDLLSIIPTGGGKSFVMNRIS